MLRIQQDRTMQVYVAIEQGWEHADILGIYLTKREAEQRCTDAHQTDPKRAYVVETHEVGGKRISREVVNRGDE